MARANVARSPARMPRARSEGLSVRAAIGLPLVTALRAWCVVEPDRQPAVGFPLRRRGAREREQLLARLDAARRPAGMLALGGAGRLVGVVFVDGDDLVDAFGELAHQRVFGDLRVAQLRRLDDGVAGLERVHREAADILHAAAGADIELAVPGEGCPLRVVRVAIAQRIELQIETWPQYRLRIRQDRTRRIDAARQY